MEHKIFAFKANSKISLSSGPGGTGKSLLALFISLLAEALKIKTLLVDADSGDSIQVNFYPQLKRLVGLAEFFNGETKLEYAIKNPFPFLDVVPGSINQINNQAKFGEFVRAVEGKYSLIVFDTGARFENGGFIMLSDINYVVVDDNINAVEDAFNTIATIYKKHAEYKKTGINLKEPELRLVCNKIKNPQEKEYIRDKLNSLLRSRKLPEILKEHTFALPFIPALTTGNDFKVEKGIDLIKFLSKLDSQTKKPFMELFMAMARDLKADNFLVNSFSALWTLLAGYNRNINKLEIDFDAAENMNVMLRMMANPELNAFLQQIDLELVLSAKGGVGKTIYIDNEAALSEGNTLEFDFSRPYVSRSSQHLNNFNIEDPQTPPLLTSEPPANYRPLTEQQTAKRRIDLCYFDIDASLKTHIVIQRVIKWLKTLAPGYDRVIVDCAPGISIRNLMLNLLFKKVTLVSDISDPRSTAKTIQYLQSLTKYAAQLNLPKKSLTINLVASMFTGSPAAAEKTGQEFFDYVMAALSPEEKAYLSPDCKVRVLFREEGVRKLLSCNPETLNKYYNRIIADIPEYEDTAYVAALKKQVESRKRKNR